MASHGYSQLDINQQREKLRKLEREIQNELAGSNPFDKLLIDIFFRAESK